MGCALFERVYPNRKVYIAVMLYTLQDGYEEI